MIRQATLADIPGMQIVRHAVKENKLSDPLLVPDQDVEDYITRRGRGWVSIAGEMVTGFSIVSVTDKNIWALFVHPEQEGKGLGRALHDIMLNWYFSQTEDTLWLSTEAGTRAEKFYRVAGWTEAGGCGKGEIRFEMKAADWRRRQAIS